MASTIEVTLNGRKRTDAVPGNRLLLDYLRETAGLTGTKTGCDGGECGACTVLVDEKPTLSCLTLAGTVAGKRVDTVESLGRGERCRPCSVGFMRSWAPSAATVRRASSWLRRACCAAIQSRARARSGKRWAATSAAARAT